MIRTTCAWILLLLAASPVTAPFAACDLRALFADGTSRGASPLTAPLEGAAATIPQPAPTGGDAFSISPLVTRTLPKDSASGSAVRAARAFDRTSSARAPRLRHPNLFSCQFSASATVLRV
jgi:hypothetical protein